MNGEITSIWLCMHSRLGLVNAHWLLSKLVTFDFKITLLSCSAQPQNPGINRKLQLVLLS